MSETKHTPTPWTKDERRGTCTGADGSNVVLWDSGFAFGQRTPITEGNANFIVSCVNSHDGLVEVLRRADTLLVAVQAFIADNDLEEFTVEYDEATCDGSCLRDDANFAVTDIRAALKAAGVQL